MCAAKALMQAMLVLRMNDRNQQKQQPRKHGQMCKQDHARNGQQLNVKEAHQRGTK